MPRRMGNEMADSELTFEQARDELMTVVTALEQGTQSLEESVALWERGETLAAICTQWLDATKAKLDAAREQLPQR